MPVSPSKRLQLPHKAIFTELSKEDLRVCCQAQVTKHAIGSKTKENHRPNSRQWQGERFNTPSATAGQPGPFENFLLHSANKSRTN